jgi:hypothetical protein
LCCLFFFDIQILITPLLSSNSSSITKQCYLHTFCKLLNIILEWKNQLSLWTEWHVYLQTIHSFCTKNNHQKPKWIHHSNCNFWMHKGRPKEVGEDCDLLCYTMFIGHR